MVAALVAEKVSTSFRPASQQDSAVEIFVASLRTLEDFPVDLGASVWPNRGHSCPCVHRSFSVVCAAVLHSGLGSSTTLRTAAASTRRRLKRANMSFAEALVATLEESDQYTAGHSRLSRSIREISQSVWDLPPRAHLLVRSCPRHREDWTPGPSLLLKTGPLTLEERCQMQEHSAIGESILNKVDLYADVAEFSLQITMSGSMARAIRISWPALKFPSCRGSSQ